MTKQVALVRTGIANIGSVLAALHRAGHEATFAADAASVLSVQYLIVPGVGHFAHAMQYLRDHQLESAVKERVTRGLPTLFVCVGLQLLASTSEEGNFGTTGLNLVSSKVLRFPATVRVPQQGWNKVVPSATMNFISEGFAYFSNSFAFREIPAGEGWLVAWANHGVPFVAALERGAVLACQFHPELSSVWGENVLASWLAKSGSLANSVNGLPPAVANIPPASLSTGQVTRRIIPCLDVKDGKVVKGIQFQNLKESGIPSDRAFIYQKQGADEIVILDVSATIEMRKTRYDTVRSVRAVLNIPLTVGGGVTSVEDAQALLESGADKVAINSAAVKDPSLIGIMANAFGNQCVVVAIDAVQNGDNKWIVVVKGGKEKTDVDAVAWAQDAVNRGAGEVLLTSWDRDGTKSGYDLALLEAVSSRVHVPVIASGGAATADHLAEGLAAGADAVLAASIFHYEEFTVEQLKTDLSSRSLPIRI